LQCFGHTVTSTDADHERIFLAAHDRILMSGERKIILFNLYDHILLQTYFRLLIWNFDTFMTIQVTLGIIWAININF
jgi:hypothetical protein